MRGPELNGAGAEGPGDFALDDTEALGGVEVVALVGGVGGGDEGAAGTTVQDQGDDGALNGLGRGVAAELFGGDGVVEAVGKAGLQSARVGAGVPKVLCGVEEGVEGDGASHASAGDEAGEGRDGAVGSVRVDRMLPKGEGLGQLTTRQLKIGKGYSAPSRTVPALMAPQERAWPGGKGPRSSWAGRPRAT